MTCDLCYESIKESEFYSLKCQHTFCKLCHEEYLESQIDAGKVMNIGCMQSGCTEVFGEDEIRDCVNDSLFNKYMRFQRNAIVDLDPNLRWCPEASCENYVHRSTKKKQDIIQCDECFTEICFPCGEKAHIGRECGQSEADVKFEEWKKEAGAVNCPKCTIVCYKYEGCNHMTCSNCKHEFCLYDLQPCKYSDNHFRRPLFQCVCGQFGAFNKRHVLTGLESQRKCIPWQWLKCMMIV